MNFFFSEALKKDVSKLGLGSWAIGGWLWGGSNDRESSVAIEEALAHGVNFIDTAPIYGFGKAESLIGKVIASLGLRESIILATKCGLEWNEKQTNIRRNSTPERIRKEIDESRYRLQTDYIDLYQIHWPDIKTPFWQSLETLAKLQSQNTIRAIGLSNFSLEQLESCLKVVPIQFVQLPYNLYEREIEKEMLLFCQEKNIPVLGYGGLCRGLLTGKFSRYSIIKEDDIRFYDPKFKADRILKYVDANRSLNEIAKLLKISLPQLALRWASSRKGIGSMLVGVRSAAQAKENFDFDLTPIQSDIHKEIDQILAVSVPQPIGAEFMAPSLS